MRVHGDISAALLEAARALTSTHTGLGDVLAWGAAAERARGPVAVVAQDEFAHDVVIEFRTGVFLAYDVT